MKKKMTLALAASILILTFSAFPTRAAASTTSVSQADSEIRRAGGGPVVYLTVGLAAEILAVLVA